MTPAEIYGQEMAEEQRIATLSLAKEQAARNKAIRDKFTGAINGG